LLILGGDYAHQDIKYLEPVIRRLGSLKPRYGIYAVLGNHDYYLGKGKVIALMKQYGVNLLINKYKTIDIDGFALRLAGIDDFQEGKPDFKPLFSTTEKWDCFILAGHNPDCLELIGQDSSKVDLALFGHTHGGQITFFGFWAPLIPSEHRQKYRYGLKKRNGVNTYVTSGAGNITPPVRLFCRPEIAIISIN
jgi:predicted MPP superfamily phosphohydrolase